MRSALEEQGFSNSSKKMNSLVAWENSEMEVMEDILNGRGIERNVVGATHAHKSVPQYRESQDWRKLPRRKKNMSTWEVLENDLRVTREKNSLLQIENDRLTSERNSQWKSLYYSDPDKQIFMQSKLSELNIPYREGENGIEVQSCHIEKVRNIEKQYKATPTSHREVLRDLIDKLAMQVDSYDEIFNALKRQGYQVKHGKYTAVKPPDGSQYIRLKSLGEMYREQALRNRIDNRKSYENQIVKKLNSFSETGNNNVLEYRYHLTVRQYVITFKAGKLPARKVRPNQPFTFVNDAELDRLAALNRKINAGANLVSLRNDLANSEKEIAEIEKNLNQAKSDLKFFTNLYNAAVRYYENCVSDRRDYELLTNKKITAENYKRILILIDNENAEIPKLEQSLTEAQAKQKDTSESLTAFERIMSMTYTDNLVIEEKNRRQSAIVGNGVKSADMSMGESMKIDEVATKVERVVEPPPVYKPKRK